VGVGQLSFKPTKNSSDEVTTAMKDQHYTFFIASSASGNVRRVRVPFYALPFLVILAIVGTMTVAAAIGSYSRVFWKATSYNSLRREQDSLRQQYRDLQTQVKGTNQRLNSLQSLAGEVAVAYGITRIHQTPFGLTETTAETDNDAGFQQSLAEFTYLSGTSPRLQCQTTACIYSPARS
jgi:hypothetical protein